MNLHDGETANLRTEILDFRGFDSSIILIVRGGIGGPLGNFPEVLSQAILPGIIFRREIGRNDHFGEAAQLVLAAHELDELVVDPGAWVCVCVYVYIYIYIYVCIIYIYIYTHRL